MNKHPDCEDGCMVAEHKGYPRCRDECAYADQVPAKWCSYCKTNTHSDAECGATRMVPGSTGIVMPEQKPDSDTPRTDAHKFSIPIAGGNHYVTFASLLEELERELTAAQARIEELKAELEDNKLSLGDVRDDYMHFRLKEHDDLRSQLAAKSAECEGLERKLAAAIEALNRFGVHSDATKQNCGLCKALAEIEAGE